MSTMGRFGKEGKIHGAHCLERNRGIGMWLLRTSPAESPCLRARQNIADLFYMHGKVSDTRIVDSVWTQVHGALLSPSYGNLTSRPFRTCLFDQIHPSSSTLTSTSRFYFATVFFIKSKAKTTKCSCRHQSSS
jgi:hypothetical protein